MWGYAGRLGRITRMTARSGLCPTFRHEVARLAQVEDDVLRVNTAVHTVEHAAERLGALFELTDGHRVRVERDRIDGLRSEEHTSELQSLMRISYAVFCLKK